MAKKLKVMSLFQELSGRALLTNRRPAQQSSGVYLMQLRAQNGATTLPRRRLTISVDLSKTQPIPRPVKITHIRDVPASEDPGGRPVHVSVKVDAPVPQVGPKSA